MCDIYRPNNLSINGRNNNEVGVSLAPAIIYRSGCPVTFIMLKYKSEQRTILTVKWHFKKLPVIKLSYEEHCFPVFADMHSSINPPDSGREAVLVNGASATFHLKLFNHPVLMTWKNTAMSLDLGTLWKTATYHNPCQTQWASCMNCNTYVAQGCNLRVLLLEIKPCHADNV